MQYDTITQAENKYFQICVRRQPLLDIIIRIIIIIMIIKSDII